MSPGGFFIPKFPVTEDGESYFSTSKGPVRIQKIFPTAQKIKREERFWSSLGALS